MRIWIESAAMCLVLVAMFLAVITPSYERPLTIMFMVGVVVWFYARVWEKERMK